MIHGAWLKQYGIDGSYTREAVEPENVTDFLGQLGAHGFVGCNVTVPHKEAAYQVADVQHDAAKAVGAANTLWLENGQLHATNTDTHGFMAYLNQKAPDWHSNNKPVVVLGAGGAARAIIYGLLQAGCVNVLVLNRTQTRADQVRTYFDNKVNTVAWADRNDAITGAGLVINTTSLGMNGVGQPDVDLSRIDNLCVISDIVYTPLDTAFLKAAHAQGLRTVDGLGMLLHQAVPGFEKWFGVRPTVTDQLYQMIAEDVRRGQC